LRPSLKIRSGEKSSQGAGAEKGKRPTSRGKLGGKGAGYLLNLGGQEEQSQNDPGGEAEMCRGTYNWKDDSKNWGTAKGKDLFVSKVTGLLENWNVKNEQNLRTTPPKTKKTSVHQ